MQHKLNCIASVYTPISPVSHGHRAVLSDGCVCVRVRGWDISSMARFLVLSLAAASVVRVQKLALREGYQPQPVPIPLGLGPAVRQKYHPRTSTLAITRHPALSALPATFAAARPRRLHLITRRALPFFALTDRPTRYVDRVF